MSTVVMERSQEEPAKLMENFIKQGGTVWACPPCANLRGYRQDDLVEGVTISGADPVHALLKAGAATLCF